MNESPLHFSELVLLVMWLSAAPCLLASALIFISQRYLKRGSFKTIVIMILGVIMLSLPITFVLWITFPTFLLPASLLPEYWPSIPPFFLPSYVSTAFLTIIAWLLGRFIKTENTAEQDAAANP